jgi:hypothetical protein
MKIYLDIDDTLLHTDIYNRRAANHLKPFLEYMTKNHDVYWLTTHCNGDPSVPVAYLNRFVSPDITPLLLKIKPTKWEVLKSEAINMDEDFLWLDDTLSDGDEKALEAKKKLNCFAKIDLDENPNVLNEFIEKPPICRGYVVDIFKKSYMLHIWTRPKFIIGWHRKTDGPNDSIFAVRKY